MKITGYAIREALKQHELRKDAATRAFDGSLRKFDDEEKDSPQRVVETYLKAEAAIAKLQTAQMRFNLAVNVTANGEKISLAEAIKRVGGDARAEKLWRTASGPKPDRYGGYGNNENTRDPNLKVSKVTIQPLDALKLGSQAAKRAGGFRQAIAIGNAQEVDIENLDPTLFE